LAFNILVVAHSNPGGDSAGYLCQGVIENVGGTTSLIGGVSPLPCPPLAEDPAAVPWSVDVQADNANDALQIDVTGAAATNIGWVATVRTAEVIY